jgi:hypothetical protein
VWQCKTLTGQGYDVGAATTAQHLARKPAHHQSPCSVNYLAHPEPPRLHHSTTTETTPLQLDTLHRRRTQRTLAGRVPVPIFSVHLISTDT